MTPSPTVKPKNIGESGRLHLVTSACFARTPSPTAKPKNIGESGRRGRRPLQNNRKNVGETGRQHLVVLGVLRKDAVPYD